MTYTVTAVDSKNRVVASYYTHTKSGVQVPHDKQSARKTARAWRKDPGFRNVQIISRDYSKKNPPKVKMRKPPKGWIKAKAVRVVTRGGKRIVEVKR